MGAQILAGHHAVELLHHFDDRRRRSTGVEGVGAAFGQFTKHAGEIAVDEPLAGARRVTVDQHFATVGTRRRDQLGVQAPLTGDHL